MNITRENLEKTKIEILNQNILEEVLNKEKEEIKDEVKSIISNFNKKEEEVMIDE